MSTSLQMKTEVPNNNISGLFLLVVGDHKFNGEACNIEEKIGESEKSNEKC